MTDPTFTVLLPVHRPPPLLPNAIASVLAQERQDFELFVICDGAPPETAEVARRHAAKDGRIRVFEHPKGQRNGEIYRHQALQEARGEFVCQLGDDDYWLPNHLSEMATLLAEFDFGNLSQVEILPGGDVELLGGDLADPKTRHTMATQPITPCGPTSTGYRLKAYRALPVGWAPAPPDFPSDLFMWRKFLAHEGLRFGTRVVVSSVKFSAQFRRGWSLDQRQAEIEAWVPRLSNPADRGLLTQAAMLSVSQAEFRLLRHVELMDQEAKESADRIRRMHQQMLRMDADLGAWAKRAAALEAQLRQADAALRESAARAEQASAAEARLQRTSAALEAQLRQANAALHDRAAQAAETEERLRRMDAMVGEAVHRSDKVSRKLQKMRRSWSWRLTKPFRRLVRRIERGGRRG